MSRRDLINRIASLEGSRDYWLQDRPEMTATDWANLCEEDADELRELQAQLDADEPDNLGPRAYCARCECILTYHEERVCQSCARAEP